MGTATQHFYAGTATVLITKGMRVRWLITLCVITGANVAPKLASAQSAARINIVLPSRDSLATEEPSIRTVGVATASHTAELIRNGFPARLHYKLERWAAGTFVNYVKATEEWDIIVQYDALGNQYRVVRATEGGAVVLGTFPNLKEADTNRAFADATDELIVLADHTKWGVTGLTTIAQLDDATVFVSDELLSDHAQAVLGERVGRLILSSVERVAAERSA